MNALVLSCTLKASPAPSNTEALARVLTDFLAREGIESEVIRVVDHDVKPGVLTDQGDGDAWSAIRQKVLDAEILIFATPTWLGHPSSVAQRVLERMDAMLSETLEDGTPVAYNHVAGVVNTGNEDGAHQVVAHVAQCLIDIGFTVPAQAWTYWHKGPGPGPDYLDDPEGHEWSDKTGRAAAQNLLTVARALRASPLMAPPA